GGRPDAFGGRGTALATERRGRARAGRGCSPRSARREPLLQQLEGREVAGGVARVFEIVDPLGLEPLVVEEVDVVAVELDIEEPAVRKALDAAPRFMADPEVGRAVAVERHAFTRLEVHLPDADLLVLEHELRGDLEVLLGCG